jgi:hypothetical protein
MGVIFNIEEALHNSAFNILQEPIKMILENETEAFEKESIIPKVFVMKTSDKYREEYRSTTAMDGFKPTEDMEPAGLSDFEESYNKQYVFQTWTNAFIISKQVMEDKDTMSVEPKALGFIKSYGRTRELYAVNVIGAGLGQARLSKEEKEALRKNYKITASTGLGMDTTDGTVEGTKEQYFTNKHKPVGYGAKGRTFEQSNKFHATIAFDGSDPELEEKVLDVIGQVESHMKKYKDDKGNIVPVNPTTIVMGENFRLSDVLMRGLKSKYGSRMDGNGVNLQFGKYTLVISPYLSAVKGFEDADNALLLVDPARNREGMGLVWFDRVPLQIDSYIDKKTKANVWDGRARFGAGFGDFRAMAYINLSGTDKTNSTEITPLATSVKAVKVVNTVTTKAE